MEPSKTGSKQIIIKTDLNHYLLKEKKDERPERGSGNKPPSLLCVNCKAAITDNAYAISKSGSHDHTFANLQGHMFHIGLFSHANLTLVGPYTKEFTWFENHEWRPAVCPKCTDHLGWHFYDLSNQFFALILNKLVESQP